MKILLLTLTLFFSTSCASTLINSFVNYERNKASLTKKTITVDNFDFVYLEGGEGETSFTLSWIWGRQRALDKILSLLDRQISSNRTGLSTCWRKHKVRIRGLRVYVASEETSCICTEAWT
jgi:hypothetical protein